MGSLLRKLERKAEETGAVIVIIKAGFFIAEFKSRKARRTFLEEAPLPDYYEDQENKGSRFFTFKLKN